MHQSLGISAGYLLKPTDAEWILIKANGDLPFFVFLMMYHETSEFRNNVSQHCGAVTKAIYEVIKKKKPTAIMLDLPNFQMRAERFLKYSF